MRKRNEALAFQTIPRNNATEADVSQPWPSPGSAGAASQAAVTGQTAPQGAPEQGHFSTRTTPEIITVRRLTVADRLPIHDRVGKELLRVTEAQAAKLIERRLIEFSGRSGRPVHSFRLKPGISIAAIKAVFREHITERLPIAEDNTTCVKIPGPGMHFEPIHTEEWDDGRETPGQRRTREYIAMRKAGLL